MTYFIKQTGDRWHIYAGDVCVLSCEDHATAAQTVLAAMTMFHRRSEGLNRETPKALISTPNGFENNFDYRRKRATKNI